MGLYDGYKQNNSTYIPQFVGSVVPELKDFSQIMQKRYNEARDTDDALVEAMGNLQHLDSEEDTTYANELKQTYMSRLMDRSEREDYENLGRRTKRDAQQFSSDYVPLVNRMKGMQSIQERVLQDKDIHSPETKQKILGRIKYMNGTERDPETGDFVRDASGKIKLGAIQDWAYAKDVDINKKLADFLKAKETEISQSGYASNGQGLMNSVKRETRSATDIARLAKEMMETDPEIKAMVYRDVELSTYNYSQAEVSEIANKNNVSVYDRLKKSGVSDVAIRAKLKASGMTVEEARVKPIDALRQRFTAAGRSTQEADQAFLKEETRKQLMSPHIDLVSNLLKVDRQTLEAREDPAFSARALGAAIGAAMSERDRGEAIPIQVQGSDIQSVDIRRIQETVGKTNELRQELETSLQSEMGKLVGTPPPGMSKVEIQKYYNKTSELLNNPVAQAKLLADLQATGNHAKARDLQVAVDRYRSLSNQAMMEGHILDQVKKNGNFDSLYDNYKSSFKSSKYKPVDKATFFKMLDKPEDKSMFAKLDRVFPGIGAVTSDGFEEYRKRYNDALQLEADKMIQGKSLKTAFTSLEPVNGKIKKQTESLTNGIQNGSIKIKDLITGESLDDILAKDYGSGWFYQSKSDTKDDIKSVNSDVNNARKGVRATYNLERAADGRMTSTLSLPNGKTRTVVLEDVPPAYGNGILNEFYGNSAMMMSRSEATNFMTTAAVAAGTSTLTKMNVPQMRSLTPSAMAYELNDVFGVKVMEAGVGAVKDKVYQLMIKDRVSGKMQPSRIKPTTDYQTILGIIGQQELKRDWPSSGPGISNPTE